MTKTTRTPATTTQLAEITELVADANIPVALRDSIRRAMHTYDAVVAAGCIAFLRDNQ